MSKKYCTLSAEAESLLKQSFDKLDLSARGYYRILKVARTIADLADSDRIELPHITEALRFRGMDKKQ
jgi:magnesium chelatase family protein